MGDHRTNPMAIAKAAGAQQLPMLELGDGYVVAGFNIQPLMRPASDEEGAPMVLVAGLVAMAGKTSPLAITTELHPVLVGEIGGIPVEALKKALEARERPQPETVAQ